MTAVAKRPDGPVFIRPGGKIVGDQFHIPPLFGQGFQFPGHFRLPRTQASQLVLQPPLFLGGKLRGRAGGAGETQGAQRLLHGGGLPLGAQQEHTGLLLRGGEHLPVEQQPLVAFRQRGAQAFQREQPRQGAIKAAVERVPENRKDTSSPSQASS